jgi:uncharacterized membrane protein
MSTETIPNDIPFNTFNNTNLNYDDSDEKIIKLPAINFNIATSATNSDITNLKNIVNSYKNPVSGGGNGGYDGGYGGYGGNGEIILY